MPAALIDCYLIAIAPIAGSFVGLVAQRLPAGESILWPRSHCLSCRGAIAARDLIPLASWVMLRGRCRSCRQTIGPYHPLVEVSAVLIAVWAILAFDGVGSVLACLLGWVLLTIAIIDWNAFIIPDVLSLPLGAIGLAVASFGSAANFGDHLFGAVAGAGVLWLARQIYFWIRSTEGLGSVDS